MNIKYASLLLVLNIIGINAAVTNGEAFDTLYEAHTQAVRNYDDCKQTNPYSSFFKCKEEKRSFDQTKRLFTEVANTMKKPLNDSVQKALESNDTIERLDGRVADCIKTVIENAQYRAENGYPTASGYNEDTSIQAQMEFAVRPYEIAGSTKWRFGTDTRNPEIDPVTNDVKLVAQAVIKGHKKIKELCSEPAR